MNQAGSSEKLTSYLWGYRKYLLTSSFSFYGWRYLLVRLTAAGRMFRILLSIFIFSILLLRLIWFCFNSISRPVVSNIEWTLIVLIPLLYSTLLPETNKNTRCKNGTQYNQKKPRVKIRTRTCFLVVWCDFHIYVCLVYCIARRQEKEVRMFQVIQSSSCHFLMSCPYMHSTEWTEKLSSKLAQIRLHTNQVYTAWI